MVRPFDVKDISEYINKTAPKPSEEYSCSPNGWMYKKDVQGVIPREVAKVFNQRKEWKNKMLTATRNLEQIESILNDRES